MDPRQSRAREDNGTQHGAARAGRDDEHGLSDLKDIPAHGDGTFEADLGLVSFG